MRGEEAFAQSIDSDQIFGPPLAIRTAGAALPLCVDHADPYGCYVIENLANQG